MTTQVLSPMNRPSQEPSRNRLTDTLPLGSQALIVQADNPRAKALLLAEIYSYLLARRQARLTRQTDCPESQNVS